MNYYILEPEVAGGLGEKTILDTTVHPPDVKALNYEFAGWDGDVLLESFPCFITTVDAADKLKKIAATGVRYEDVYITKSGEFEDFYPGRDLPKFRWLKITGEAGVEDFGISIDFRIVVSQRALDVFKSLGLSNAVIEPFQGQT